MEAEERKEHKCLRCGYRWLSRLEHPKSCTKCKSPYWSKERQMIKQEAKEHPWATKAQVKRIVKDHEREEAYA